MTLVKRFSDFLWRRRTKCAVTLQKETTLAIEQYVLITIPHKIRTHHSQAGEKTIMGTSVLDNIESINIPKYNNHLSTHPRAPYLQQFSPEISHFSRLASNLASKIFVLLALILELPENHFASAHTYDDPSEDHLRYMLYHPRSESDDAKVSNTWSRAHTDFGSLTLLWSQEVAGLQLKTPEGKWKYVPPVDGGGVVCNVGDAVAFWSAGYLKSTIHRVVRPPEDQIQWLGEGNESGRLGLFYFVRPGNEVEIGPVRKSKLLKRLGLVGSDGDVPEERVTGLRYVRERVRNYHDRSDYSDMKGKKFQVGMLEIEDEAE